MHPDKTHLLITGPAAIGKSFFAEHLAKGFEQKNRECIVIDCLDNCDRVETIQSENPDTEIFIWVISDSAYIDTRLFHGPFLKHIQIKPLKYILEF